MANLRRFRILAGIAALLFVFTIFLGCARLKTSTKKSERPEPAASKQDKTPVPLYYDFEDVQVP